MMVVLIALGIALVVFWIVQLVTLMEMKDAQFPGRHDKVLWFVLMLICSVLGACVFWAWRQQRAAEEEVDKLANDLGRMIPKPPEPEQDAE